MKAAVIIAMIQLLPEIKNAVSSLRKPNKTSTVVTPHSSFLSYSECVYVVSVYEIACRHNKIFPSEEVSDDQLVRYFNTLFNRHIPIRQYQKVWHNFKPKKSNL